MKKPLPVLGHASALVHFFRDPDASLAGKVFLAAAALYVVFPFDLIPDVLPIVGWLDDLGVAAMAFAYLASIAARYRREPARVIARRG